MKKFYLTTAIDYVNSPPHIGTAYEKVGADVLARFLRMKGFEVRFQMGNDEHSLNVEKAARERGQEPPDYCREMQKVFEEVWRRLNISYDGFIRTTEEHHIRGVQQLFECLRKKGDIYKAPYEGWYCESCEAFYTEKDLENGLCPNHKSKPKWLHEENYFFRLSKYEKKLLRHIRKNSGFIRPELRRNEILNVIEGGLKDISVSRAGMKWGIPLPHDTTHSVYVWFDALINYLTAVGYGTDARQFKKWWPADLHVIGKDITRFHCVIWPAMLMAAGIPLPKSVFGHGFVYFRGEKMSKTLGNVVTPMDIVPKYGADPLRYTLMRTSGFGADGDFTWDDFIRRYNGDLANGLGNLVSRVAGMIEQYTEGKITPPPKKNWGPQKAFWEEEKKYFAALEPKGEEIPFHDALRAVWFCIRLVDQDITEVKPWELRKKGKAAELALRLYHWSEAIRKIALLLKPFLPETSERIWKQFCFDGNFKDQPFDKPKRWGGIRKPLTTGKKETLFPRIEEKTMNKEEITNSPELLDIRDFAKLDLRVAQITEAEKVEGADRLLKLQVDLGTEKRQIVAGIAPHYPPQELVGKKVVVVANLKPAVIRGVESRGMLLAASDTNTLAILTPARDVAVGSKVK